MLISELLQLNEKVVSSSWLADVTYMNFIKKKEVDPEAQNTQVDPATRMDDRPKQPKSRAPKRGDVKIIVKDGRSYTVKDLPYVMYRNWQKAESKGKFWHKFIRDKYEVV